MSITGMAFGKMVKPFPAHNDGNRVASNAKVRGDAFPTPPAGDQDDMNLGE